MKKVALLLAIMLVLSLAFAGCAPAEEVAVEEPVVEATAEVTAEEEPVAEEASTETGIFFEQKEGNVVYCTDVPEPGMTFPVTTSGGFAVTCYVVDADGNKIADIEVTDGNIDYGAYLPDAVKVVIENGAAASYAEYVIPTESAAVSETGIFFEQKEGNVVYCTDVPEPGMTFPVTTSGGFAVTCYVVDADGNKIADIEVTDGNIDYGAYLPDAVKVVIENGAAAAYAEYVIPQ